MLAVTSAPVDLIGAALIFGWIGAVIVGGVRRHRSGATHQDRMRALGRVTRSTQR